MITQIMQAVVRQPLFRESTLDEGLAKRVGQVALQLVSLASKHHHHHDLFTRILKGVGKVGKVFEQVIPYISLIQGLFNRKK